MICPNDEGVMGESWENGVSVGLRRHASPDHFVYATTGRPPKGAYVFQTDGRSYCLACGDEACREEHARNVEKNRRDRIRLGLEAAPLTHGPRSRLSGLAG